MRTHDVGVLDPSLFFFTQNFFRITRVLSDRCDIIVTGILPWCLLTFRGCGSVPGSWAPRWFCNSAYRFSSGIPEVTGTENTAILFVVRVVWCHPVLGCATRCIATASIGDVLSKVWGTWFSRFSWLCVDGWIQLECRFVSCVRYLCLPVSPTPDCITWKFREFIGGNSSSYLGSSFQQMHEGYVFVPAYSTTQSFDLFWL